MRRPTKTEVGELLRDARIEARERASPEKKPDFAQAGVAQHIGVRERAVRMWEKGRASPPADQFLQLIRYYHAGRALLRLVGQWELREGGASAAGRRSKAGGE